MHPSRLLRLGSASLLALLLACNAAPAPRESVGLLATPSDALGANAPAVVAASAAPAVPDGLPSCPPGRWRQTPEPVLANVLIWLSHVLIRHAQAENPRDASFSLADWHSTAPLPPRTRAQGLELARQVAERARLHPESFPALARQYSEDITTQASGGQLGGVQAHTLVLWPAVLDCVEPLRSGDTSQVVETPYGFHVFQRLAPPPERMLSGSEIVIAHDDAGWLKVINGRAAPQRSRVDALALANEVYAQAQAEPDRFGELVAKYSEHVDARRGGDFGAWSTREATAFPREVTALDGLQVGEVAPPLDSPVGFRILKRTPLRQRQELAMSAIRLTFNEADEGSRATTLSLARLIAGIVAKEPRRFAEFQQQHCCTQLEQWQEGRGSVPLTVLLSSLSIGQLALEPVEADGMIVLARRARPRPTTRVEPWFEIPGAESTLEHAVSGMAK